MNDRDIRIIDAYLLGELKEKEKAELEKRLKEDNDLRLEFERVKRIVASIENYGLKQDFRKFHGELEGKKGHKSENRRIYLIVGVAASLVLLLLLTFFFISRKNEKKYFYSYFEPYPNLITTRDINENGELQSALEFYNQENYQEALSHFEIYDSNHTNSMNDNLEFYYAISCLGAKRPKMALSIFERISDSRYIQQIDWYKSLCYLLLGERNQARHLLSKIEKEDFNYENAREILVYLSNH